ncbi:MAG: cyclopropane-fatty-acyl-phospholipid synthase [Gammaproteobacteria bacterium]
MSSDNKTSGATALPNRKPVATSGQAGMLSRWLAQKLLQASGNPRVRIRLWDKTELRVEDGPTPIATMRVHTRPALWRLALRPDLFFGEGYMSGEIEVDGDLVAFLEEVYRAGDHDSTGTLRDWARRVLAHRKTNSLLGSRSNIHHHYDIGNEFYRLWLDTAAMQYTCAYFPHMDASLEQAQVAKLDHVCRKLQLRPGQTVIEAGCGWGGLARHMAREYGVTVRAYNISHEQVRYARERAAAEGLADRVEYVEDDYRNISGQCDAFVSVGMLEHVGPEHYVELGRVIDRVLSLRGRGLIHSIGRNRAAPMNAWIERRIFPGAHPPSLREMMDIFEEHQFSILDVENLRPHYAETLRHWLDRYELQLDKVEEMFDAPFIRAWRLYLAGSIAAFTTGELQLFQVAFTRHANNDIPLTREYLYRTGADS